MYISLQVIKSPQDGCIQLFVYSQFFSTDANFFCTELKQQKPICTLLPENKQTIRDVCLATSHIARTADMFLSSRDKAAAK
jgi:hypothetical protein